MGIKQMGINPSQTPAISDGGLLQHRIENRRGRKKGVFLHHRQASGTQQMYGVRELSILGESVGKLHRVAGSAV